MARILRIPLDRVVQGLGFGVTPEWDSLAHVNLMLALEERLDVELDEEAVVVLTDLAAVLELVGRHEGS